MVRLPETLTERLAAIRSAGVITGAGVSAESGIPTYRGSGGLYDDPARGDATVEALSGPTLAADPDRTWCAIAELARHANRARPNAAHEAIARLERVLEESWLLTQNVDGLHRLAGSRRVIDIHGDLSLARCLACDRTAPMQLERLAGLTAAPRCDRCDGTLRPEVVLFEEMLPPDKLDAIRREFYERPKQLVVAIGTTALFPYISAPVLLARQRGALTVEIDPQPTELTPVVEFSLRGKAGDWMPALVAAIEKGTR